MFRPVQHKFVFVGVAGTQLKRVRAVEGCWHEGRERGLGYI